MLIRIYMHLDVRYTLLNMHTLDSYIFMNITYIMYIHVPRRAIHI